MRITTWNVNSVRQRLPHLLDFLREEQPDVLCLQEIKCQEDAFPYADIESVGYQAKVLGQKTFNGVALLSKTPLEDIRLNLPDDDDPQARYIEGVLLHKGRAVRVASIYLPNGNPINTEKLPYKMAWCEKLYAHMQTLLAHEEPLILCGDYNMIPTAQDARTPEAWKRDALFLPQTRAHFQSFLNLGLIDAVRACSSESGLYTFWDYQSGAWQKDDGVRIDHLLLSPQAADLLRDYTIHKSYREREKPSDHVPVSADFIFSAPHKQF